MKFNEIEFAKECVKLLTNKNEDYLRGVRDMLDIINRCKQ